MLIKEKKDYFEIQKINYDSSAKIVSDSILEPEKNYIFQINFPDCENNPIDIVIGL